MLSVVSFEKREDALDYFKMKALTEHKRTDMIGPYVDLIEGDPNNNIHLYMEKFMEIKKDKKSFSIEFENKREFDANFTLLFIECALH